MMSKESRKGNVGGKVLAVFVAVCLLGDIGVNVYHMQKETASDSKVSKFIDKELKRQAEEKKKENEYVEDGYMVGEEYEIRSTKQISDAYLSGDDSKLSKQDKKTLEMAKEILEKTTKKCKTTYEKELAIYNWMYDNIGQNGSTSILLPDSTVDHYTPAGVLSGHQAVCVGYATTFRMFMEMLGLECHIVHNEGHSWDLVKLDDGEWYHLDIYMDVSAKSRYRNFNMTDNICFAGHDWDKSAVPEAVGVKYSYPAQNAVEVDDIYEMPAMLKKAFVKKKGPVCVKFKKKLTEQERGVIDYMYERMQSAMDSGLLSENGASIEAYWYGNEKDEDNYLLGVYFSYYGEPDTSDDTKVDKDAEKKMKNAIEKAFDISLDDISAEP